MPEGDTIFRAARTLHRALAGKVVTRFESVLPHLARIDVDRPIAGRTVESVTARGKHQLMRFSGDLVLRTHMRMNGSWHVYRPGERWQRPRSAMRIVVATADFVAVGFDVPDAELLTSRDLQRHAGLRSLGPDLLGAFDAADAGRRIRERGADAIGEVLLDQRVLAGVGNVFKSEILFLARVHPSRRVRTLSDEEVRTVVDVSRKLLAANVAEPAGGAAVSWAAHRRTTGRLHPDEPLWVYGRSGEPCRRCGTPIAYAKQGLDARVTYWCPRCQPEPPPGA
ncbi:MAG TPA: DNA-formamidopyrimidine glycosylase family protein [Anaeromyxobacteraceae bacterium]|nr:DNA-formamidopyrimidine glycosylase family protein [Anaeromyxobacteraceae bacterium]